MNSPLQKALAADGKRRRRRSESPPAAAAVLDAPRPALGSANEAALGPLIITGWIIGLSYLPSGLLHAVLGDLVYARDLALGVHLLACTIWLARVHQLGWVMRRSWFVFITPLLLLPAVANPLYTLEALRTSKWSFAWLDWIMLGYLVRQNTRWGETFMTLLWVTLAMMAAEWAAGVYDWVSGNHLIKETWGEKTVFGVSRMFDETIGGRIRIRGLQRDVFSFANIMAMNAVAGMAYLMFTRKASHQLRAALWIFAFGALMVLSGGRSAIFGVLAAFLYTVGLFTSPRITRRFERLYVLVWVGIALTLSLVGVGRFTDFVGSTLLGGSYVGDSESAFMRDDYWTLLLRALIHYPMILLAGGPAVAMADTRVDPMFHWADNQLLWNVYHLGIVGSVAFAFLFYKVLRPEVRDDQQRKVRQALIVFLVFVIGEGIARESLTLVGCLPLFVLCGYEGATERATLSAPLPPSPLRRISRRRSGENAG